MIRTRTNSNIVLQLHSVNVFVCSYVKHRQEWNGKEAGCNASRSLIPRIHVCYESHSSYTTAIDQFGFLKQDTVAVIYCSWTTCLSIGGNEHYYKR